MTAPDEPRQKFPRWPWLDRWFEPPWRALLSWLALAALMGVAFDLNVSAMAAEMVRFCFDQMDRVLPLPLHPVMRAFAICSNFALLSFWFEPFVLRLSLLRSLAWFGLRIVVTFVVNVIGQPDYALKAALALFVWAVLTVPVLRGACRRPWMAALGGMLMFAVVYFLMHVRIHGPTWWMPPTIILPYAAVVLYGARRLPR